MKNSIRKQMKFLILLSIYDDEDYQKTGITSDNLLVTMSKNKAKWYEVGKVSEQKDFPTSLKFELSGLEKKQILKRNYNKKYVMGKSFEQGLIDLVADISAYLELDIELGEWQWTVSEDKEEIMDLLEDGTIPFSVLSTNDMKKMNFLTLEQMTRLAQLSIQFDCYE